MLAHLAYTVDIWIYGGSFCSSCTNKPWDGNQGLIGSVGERASLELSVHICLRQEHSVWQVLPSSHATRAAHHPAVWVTGRASQHQRHWGRSHSNPHPVTAGAASHVNALVHEREYTTCLRTTGTVIHAYDLCVKHISFSYFSFWKQQHDRWC